MAASSIGGILRGWRSPEIPSTTRKPWQVYADDLACRKADIGAIPARKREALLRELEDVRTQGSRSAYLALPSDVQQTYADVSLLELAAYVRWRRHAVEAFSSSAGRKDLIADGMSEHARWDALSPEEKSEWVPDDGARDTLVKDGRWALLLEEAVAMESCSPTAGQVESPEGLQLAAKSACGALQSLFCNSAADSKKAVDNKMAAGSTSSSSSSSSSSSGGGAARRAGASHVARRGRRHGTRKGPLLKREIDGGDWVCSICKNDEASEGNDIVKCDMCDLAFHQLCHRPIVNTCTLSEEWSCSACRRQRVDSSHLSLRAGDFAWAQCRAHDSLWPARVISVDCTSQDSKEPYFIHFFGMHAGRGRWLAGALVRAWSAHTPSGTRMNVAMVEAVEAARAAGAPELVVKSEQQQVEDHEVLTPPTKPQKSRSYSCLEATASTNSSKRGRRRLPDYIIEGAAFGSQRKRRKEAEDIRSTRAVASPLSQPRKASAGRRGILKEVEDEDDKEEAPSVRTPKHQRKAADARGGKVPRSGQKRMRQGACAPVRAKGSLVQQAAEVRDLLCEAAECELRLQALLAARRSQPE